MLQRPVSRVALVVPSHRVPSKVLGNKVGHVRERNVGQQQRGEHNAEAGNCGGAGAEVEVQSAAEEGLHWRGALQQAGAQQGEGGNEEGEVEEVSGTGVVFERRVGMRR